MKLVKLLMISLIVIPVLGFVGCATNGTHQMLSYQTPARYTNQSVEHATVNAPTQAGYTSLADETSKRIGHSPQTPSLITLAPNDDLNSIVKNASGVVLVDFYADWCGPCRRQGSILLEMESSASEQGALIVKINVDQHKNLASKFQVSALPTLMLVKDGQIIDRQTGMADHQRVAALLSR